MCGITGAIAFTESGKKYLGKIADAVKSLKHRGPDGEGIFLHDHVAFGHTRLAIIDTTSLASQPFTSNDGRYTIILNGEIFNYRELRAELEKEGMQFRSKSDTEILLGLFSKKGKSCLEMLNGFFAFAIHDKIDNSVFIARDRFGEKPFFYYSDNDVFLFASEPKAIAAFGVEIIPDEDVMPLFFHLNYTPSCEHTLLAGIHEIPQGSYAGFSEKKSFQLHKYYSLPHHKKEISYEEAKKEFRRLLEKAVTDRLVSDVPLGSFLSGGLDSSVVTAIAAKHKEHLETFSIGFRDQSFFDETKFAESVSAHLGTRHHVFSVTNDDLLASLHSFFKELDEPFADSSVLALNILSQETKKHVTVALSGDGADELLGGYNKHEAELRVRKKGLSNFIIDVGAPMLGGLPQSRNSRFSNRMRQLGKYAEGLKLSATERYYRWAGFCTDEEVDRLLLKKRSRNSRHIEKEIVTGIHHNGEFNEVLRADMRIVLEGDMLVKVDRMSMWNGLEVRPPFLDHHLVDFVMQLPSDFKIEPGNRKKILRESFHDLLPAEIFTRKKQGFEVPLLKWFRNELSGMIEELLNEKFIHEQHLFNPEEIKKLRRRLNSNNPGDSVARIWGLIVFQKWWKKYVENK
ncbi:MAG: asparagine synthase (glutamine-hydrolyzing) [Bacteroidetes bacterium]|nr:asparagine synthase (glutamine-hydrolyzing) [Bacteroidota bacterium]